ncbi:MAG: hypothetical protein Q4Q06_07735, partial [Bacteroidota bacterium]|nr:hypothetical protein [Bacteroidota bacterium]
YDNNLNYKKETKIKTDKNFLVADVYVFKEGLLINCNRSIKGVQDNANRKEMVYKLFAIDF